MMRTSTEISSFPPTRWKRFFLEDAEELRLERVIEVADLVEEKRRIVGLLEFPDPRRRRPVKAPRSWPKSSDSRSSREWPRS